MASRNGVDDVAIAVEVLAAGGGDGDVFALTAVVPVEKLKGVTASDDAGSLVMEEGSGVVFEDCRVVAQDLESNACRQAA